MGGIWELAGRADFLGWVFWKWLLKQGFGGGCNGNLYLKGILGVGQFSERIFRQLRLKKKFTFLLQGLRWNVIQNVMLQGKLEFSHF